MIVKSVKPIKIRCMNGIDHEPAVWEVQFGNGNQTLNLCLCEHCMKQACEDKLDLSKWLKIENRGE